jgi:hypothetical protein
MLFYTYAFYDLIDSDVSILFSDYICDDRK